MYVSGFNVKVKDFSGGGDCDKKKGNSIRWWFLKSHEKEATMEATAAVYQSL